MENKRKIRLGMDIGSTTAKVMLREGPRKSLARTKCLRECADFLKAHHQLQYHFVLLGFLGDASLRIEILFKVQAQIRAEGFAEAEGDACRDAMALVVGDDELARGFIAGFPVALAGHHVIAGQERHLGEDLAQGEVVVGKGVDGVHIIKGVVRILLEEVFCLDVETVRLEVRAEVVGVHPDVFRLDALHAQRQVEAVGGEKLGFGGVIHLLVPYLLVGQTGAVVKAAFQDDGYLCGQGVS